MQKKNPAKRRPERLVVTLLSLLFLSTAVFATVKYVFRAPELDTDKPVVTPDGTASTDVDRTGTDEPDALGRTRRKYCYNILVSGLDDDNGGQRHEHPRPLRRAEQAHRPCESPARYAAAQ